MLGKSYDLDDILTRYLLVTEQLEGQTVLELGVQDAEGIATLLNVGARRVVAASLQPEQLKEDLQDYDLGDIEVHSLSHSRFPFGDNRFQMIIGHNLPTLLKTYPSLFEEIRRILSPDGFLLCAVENPELAEEEDQDSAISYEALYEILGSGFEDIAVYAQAPLMASLFFDLENDSDDPSPTLDRNLLTDDTIVPRHLVLVAGQSVPRRDDLLIAQITTDNGNDNNEDDDDSEIEVDIQKPESEEHVGTESALRTMEQTLHHHRIRELTLQDQISLLKYTLQQNSLLNQATSANQLTPADPAPPALLPLPSKADSSDEVAEFKNQIALQNNDITVLRSALESAHQKHAEEIQRLSGEREAYLNGYENLQLTIEKNNVAISALKHVSESSEKRFAELKIRYEEMSTENNELHGKLGTQPIQPQLQAEPKDEEGLTLESNVQTLVQGIEMDTKELAQQETRVENPGTLAPVGGFPLENTDAIGRKIDDGPEQIENLIDMANTTPKE
ncbi:class I SAM-dependent methyltransferase [Myxococcota bacterium]|nr:class I SAM-dependent methyltransferase [Myxococcota bacterium]